MKTLIDHINEALKIGKNISSFSAYSCQPTNKDELKEIINKRIKQEGTDCNLNDIDVSLITDMSFLFNESKFTGNISNWDTSNVKDMFRMFYGSAFSHDISNWNIRRDCNTEMMFNGCPIKDEFKPSILQSNYKDENVKITHK